jgi:RNA polymerase sigma-70 factor (ECF subfamily)
MDWEDLVGKAQAGDREAFWTLIEPECERLLRFVRSRVRNPEDALDLTQEILLGARNNLPQLAKSDWFRYWLWGVARNVIASWVRNLRNFPISLTDEHEAELTAAGPEPTAVLELWEEVDALPEEQREVIRLKYAGRCTHAEMAHILGIAESTVNKRLCEAREQLRRRWRGYGSWEGKLFDPEGPTGNGVCPRP